MLDAFLVCPGNSARNRFLAAPVHRIPTVISDEPFYGLQEAVHLWSRGTSEPVPPDDDWLPNQNFQRLAER